jgi:UDP-N-acetylmuramoyl-L-alanyl-D-glutamate--2,6-diaminopimelate ligase
MFKSGILDTTLRQIKKIIPKSVFSFFQPVYHWKLAMLGAIFYGFPAKSLKIIAVTGTKGKSTTVYMITKILENAGLSVAAIGSLGYKIKDKEWPNTLKMTMPGRFKIQKFLSQAKKDGCEYVVMEVTSEGIAQYRLTGINIDCAVFTNLHKEHIESHGSFENYLKAKQKLFEKTKHIQVINIDDPYFEKFANYPAKIKITCGVRNGLINPQRFDLNLKLLGDFNEANALAALGVADAYRLDLKKAVEVLNSIETISGRMEVINAEFKSLKFKVVVDYAHTPDSLKLVYENLKPQANKLICVLGAAGGGRDKWKRPEFGKIAAEFCDEIILTNEDPYDEKPDSILDQIESGFSKSQIINSKYETNDKYQIPKFKRILDREEAIKTALTDAKEGDIVVITGKGSEVSMALANGRKIPWSDKEVVLKLMR